MRQIVWLASYPKSGNTWFRIFLANFQRNDRLPADINTLGLTDNASSRSAFDDAVGLESSDLTPEEIDCYRAAAYRRRAAEGEELLWLKVHDAYTFDTLGRPMTPADVSRCAIYIARNPLDVAVSFAHHLVIGLDRAIDQMALGTAALAANRNRLSIHLRAQLLSWSEHVSSWLDQSEIPVHLIRYEDMLFRPDETFGEAVRFLGLDTNMDRVRRAIRHSSFAILQAQERSNGFREKMTAAKCFFREGRAGAWRNTLTEQQAQRVVRAHHAVMQRLGYLSADGRIL